MVHPPKMPIRASDREPEPPLGGGYALGARGFAGRPGNAVVLSPSRLLADTNGRKRIKGLGL